MSWFVVLTGPPGPGLDDGQAREAERLTGGSFERLAVSAGQIAVAARPSLDALRATLPGIDINAVPAASRRKRLLIADMDSTVIPVECIDLVAEAAGVGEAVRAVTERAMAGEIGFEESLRQRIAHAEGLAAATLETIWSTRISLNPGARAMVRTMAASGAHTALVSGGFSFFTERVAAAAGFAEHRANRLVVEQRRLVGRVEEPILGREAKVEVMEEMIAQFGLTRLDVLAVGDGANDLGMIRAAGLGVGYQPKPLLAEAADAIIEHADLTALLYLQGYREEEIAQN